MPTPTYYARAGWLPGDWTEIGSKWSWAQIVGNFRWEELQAGPLPDADVEELQITRKVATMFDRLSTGECRVQMDNSRGQYTGTQSVQNLIGVSDVTSGTTFWTATRASLSHAIFTGREFAIDAPALVEDTSNNTHFLAGPFSTQIVSGQLYTLAVDILPGLREKLWVRFSNDDGLNYIEGQVDPRSLTAAFGAGQSSQVTGTSVFVVTSGSWVRASVTGRMPSGFGRPIVFMANSANAPSYTGNGSAWIGVRAFQLSATDGPIAHIQTEGTPIIPRDTKINAGDVFTLKAQDGSSVYNVFSGYVEQWGFNPALKDIRKLQFSCTDVAERLRPIVVTSLLLNVTHKTIAQAILSQCQIDAQQYTIDQMNDLVSVSFLDQMSAGEALAVLQQNGAQLYYVDGAGRLRLRSRHWDVASTPAVSSTAAAFAFSVSLSQDSIINRLELTTTPRVKINDITTVAWISDAVFVPAASTRQFVLDFMDAETNETGTPVIDVQAQVRGTDYAFNQAPTGNGGDITSQIVVVASASATAAFVTVSNPGAGNGYLTVCQLKGKPARRQPTISKLMRDDASIAKYQERYVGIRADLVGTDNRLRDLGEFLLAERANPVPQISFALKNEWPANLAVDLLSRVFISNSLANISSVFGVFELEHTIQFGLGVEHVTQYKANLIPIKNWFTLDSPTLGRLNFNRLGS